MTLLHRHIDLLFTVKQRFAVHTDITFIRGFNTRNTAQRHTFAAAGSPQKRQSLIARVTLHIELKSAEIFLYLHIQ